MADEARDDRESGTSFAQIDTCEAVVKLWSLRRNLYRGARILGDVQAIERGPTGVAKRAERRWLWRIIGRLLRKA